MCPLILKAIVAEVVSARSPDRAVASPYDGMRRGRDVMMNMPNPNPVVLCTKLAPMVSRIMYAMLSICAILYCKVNQNGSRLFIECKF